jgi:hypothetical protein
METMGTTMATDNSIQLRSCDILNSRLRACGLNNDHSTPTDSHIVLQNRTFLANHLCMELYRTPRYKEYEEGMKVFEDARKSWTAVEGARGDGRGRRISRQIRRWGLR